MGDRFDHVMGHTPTSEGMAHGNVYAPVGQVDRFGLSLFRPDRDQRLSLYAVAS
jgi:hypothetical protein